MPNTRMIYFKEGEVVFMPVGIILNGLAVIIGGILGSFLGDKMSIEWKEKLTMVFAACAMTMGITSMMHMKNMPAVIFSVIAGLLIGLVLQVNTRIVRAAKQLEKIINKILGQKAAPSGLDRAAYENMLIICIVLFCASGTGIYGSIVSGMTGDHSILIAKSIMDLPTAMIFACELGVIVSFIAFPQFIIFMVLFLLAKTIYPYCTPNMIGDFKACGGVLLLATGFRMLKLKDFPIADMIPAMIIIMPLSALWERVILPLL